MCIRCLVAGLVAVVASAQDAQEADRAIIRPNPAPVVEYHPPTAKKRLHDFALDTFGPFALASVVAGAAVEQLTNTAPEWGQGANAYGLRIGDVFGRQLASNALEYGSAAVLHEDTAYFPCQCRGVWRRTGHALLSTFTAHRPSGGRTFALSRFLGIYGGATISQSWYPHRYSALGDGVRTANWGVASVFGINVGYEFWPDVRHKLFNK